MIVPGIGRYCLLIFLLGWLSPAPAFGHGGVVEEDDLCIIKVSFLRAHFKIYQPLASGHEQYCEDLPTAAESVFVMEYQHDSLSSMPIDFRIISDVTGKGRFARMEDIELIEDIDAATVFFKAPAIEPDVYAINHRFDTEGDYIGIVSATHPETGKVYAAVFPFEVGFTGIGYWPIIIALLVAIQVQYLIMSGRLKSMLRGVRASAGLLLVFCLTPQPASADYTVTYDSPDGTPVINRMHSWILHVADEDGTPVLGAKISVDGGMPEHDHGLPTRPRVTRELGGGNYRLDGLRFHMNGRWEIVVSITVDGKTTDVVLPIEL